MGFTSRLLAAVALLDMVTPRMQAALFFRRGAGGPRGSNIALRRRVHVNTLITEPGTAEVEWSHLYSLTTTNYAMPSTIKYTPEGRHILWGRTEFSAAFDSIDNSETAGERSTQFSDRLTFAANSVLFDGEKLDIAVQPLVTFFLRDESGARIGATAIARYDAGRNSTGVTASWSAATVSSPTNPAGTFDLGFGFGRRLMPSGFLGHFTPHVNAVWEKSTGVERMVSVFEGVEYQITEKVALDFSGQHFSLIGGTPDHQIVIGLTVNLGKLR
ncbi:MAG: hypothetical protein HYR60_12030 [Acidobacteria bacterium]|nr:hypothetical protein [Acidobacteriota bacterium]MBI3472972.1 hypothetical protein [Candidatus Solibacter usitatus]